MSNRLIVDDPSEATNIIMKGSVTYQQAVNIAKAGTIDSLIYDAKNSCVSTASAFGISAIITFARNIWNHDSFDIALKKSMYDGLRVGGNAFVTSVLNTFFCSCLSLIILRIKMKSVFCKTIIMIRGYKGGKVLV